MTTGTWADVDTQDLEGTNAFRLMPTDALVDRPATGVVVPAAGGFGLCVQYDWVHPGRRSNRTASCSPDVMVLRMT